jgi:hypothetical protein
VKKIVETPRKGGKAGLSNLGNYLHTTSTGATIVRLPVCFLRINRDIAVWAAPLELCCGVAIAVRTSRLFHSPSILAVAVAGWAISPRKPNLPTAVTSPRSILIPTLVTKTLC